MAKKSVIARNKRRTILANRVLKIRQQLKELLRKDPEMADEVSVKFQKKKRNESLTRVRARCNVCGRGNATLKKFGLCRIHLREAMMRGDVPGLRKASW